MLFDQGTATICLLGSGSSIEDILTIMGDFFTICTDILQLAKYCGCSGRVQELAIQMDRGVTCLVFN